MKKGKGRAVRLGRWAVLLGLFFSIACAGGQRRAERSRMMQQHTLATSAGDFWDAIRWERYDAASVHAQDKILWLAVSDALLDAQGTFRVADYAIISAEVEVGEDLEPSIGTVIVRYELTTLPTQRLERRSTVQTWVRTSGAWKLQLEGDEAALFLAEP